MTKSAITTPCQVYRCSTDGTFYAIDLQLDLLTLFTSSRRDDLLDIGLAVKSHELRPLGTDASGHQVFGDDKHRFVYPGDPTATALCDLPGRDASCQLRPVSGKFWVVRPFGTFAPSNLVRLY